MHFIGLLLDILCKIVYIPFLSLVLVPKLWDQYQRSFPLSKKWARPIFMPRSTPIMDFTKYFLLLIPFYVSLLMFPSCSKKVSITYHQNFYNSNSKSPSYYQKGIASWYGPNFHGKKCASGETYNMYAYTAAHKTLPFNTLVEVTNLYNNKKVIVRINDRGPFKKNRIIDLSYAAAKKINMLGPGTAPVVLKEIKAPTTKKYYYIQVGSFESKINAYRTYFSLKKMGFYHAEVNKVKVGNKQFWRVTSGIYHSRERAKNALSKIGARYPNAFIVAR